MKLSPEVYGIIVGFTAGVWFTLALVAIANV